MTVGDRFGTALTSADFNGDGRADLAVGAPLDRDGHTFASGSVTVLLGSASGITTSGSRQVTKESTGVLGASTNDSAHPDRFGETLGSGFLTTDYRSDLVIGSPGSPVTVDGHVRRSAGVVHVLPGSASGVTATGDAVYSQETTGIGGAAETGDQFGLHLDVGQTGRRTWPCWPSRSAGDSSVLRHPGDVTGRRACVRPEQRRRSGRDRDRRRLRCHPSLRGFFQGGLGLLVVGVPGENADQGAADRTSGSHSGCHVFAVVLAEPGDGGDGRVVRGRRPLGMARRLPLAQQDRVVRTAQPSAFDLQSQVSLVPSAHRADTREQGSKSNRLLAVGASDRDRVRRTHRRCPRSAPPRPSDVALFTTFTGLPRQSAPSGARHRRSRRDRRRRHDPRGNRSAGRPRHNWSDPSSAGDPDHVWLPLTNPDQDRRGRARRSDCQPQQLALPADSCPADTVWALHRIWISFGCYPEPAWLGSFDPGPGTPDSRDLARSRLGLHGTALVVRRARSWSLVRVWQCVRRRLPVRALCHGRRQADSRR